MEPPDGSSSPSPPKLARALVAARLSIRQHEVLDAEHPDQGFESHGAKIDCAVSRNASGFAVRFDALVAASSGKTERLEFSQLGGAVVSPAVLLGRLLPCVGSCSVGQSAP